MTHVWHLYIIDIIYLLAWSCKLHRMNITEILCKLRILDAHMIETLADYLLFLITYNNMYVVLVIRVYSNILFFLNKNKSDFMNV